MKTGALTLLIAQATLTISTFAQVPEGFHWLNFRSEAPTLASISEALKKEDFTAIRDVGIAGDHALVFTISREPNAPTPNDDFWKAFDVSLRTGSHREILHGYKVQFQDWLQISDGMKDLSIVCLDCWECEPTSIFTAFHFETDKSWRARWSGKESNWPGIPFLSTDVGEPFTDEDVDQVFAVLAPKQGNVSAGTWYHSRDTRTSKLTSTVEKFSADPATGRDIHLTLEGPEATAWATQLCESRDIFGCVLVGQTSRSCKRLTTTKPKP